MKESGAPRSGRHARLFLQCGMTIVIQNCKSHAYLDHNGKWTADPNTAVSFASLVLARSYIQSNSLSEAQIVMLFADPKHNVVLPISDECRDKAA